MATIQIVDGHITAEERRKTIREMANITINAYPDIELDRRIIIADQAARMCYAGNTIPTDTDDKIMYIHISNLETAIAILTGIGKTSSLEMVKIYMDEKKQAMKGISDRDTNANTRVIKSTRGIGKSSGGPFV